MLLHINKLYNRLPNALIEEVLEFIDEGSVVTEDEKKL